MGGGGVRTGGGRRAGPLACPHPATHPGLHSLHTTHSLPVCDVCLILQVLHVELVHISQVGVLRQVAPRGTGGDGRSAQC